ncbi:MAG: SDR family NAD(P)-dependent oxidoreductase [Chlorobium sp.]|uniref:SDR family oxidoreductase n=1 Tax=Chlorobium sp. TaxID=1095 RepID=UPI0025B94A5D|nr:SDR family NAD(P)-dependent oxidoreductase [Chlorobium sp.]MCF8383542.1 SDR family NAD(P)-dependent oxidoreductase [Chlorobium sp.]
MNLQNRIAVVTGSSSGIGLHTASELLEKGAVVYGLSRRETPIGHERFRWIGTDLSVPFDIAAAFLTIRELDGAISVLVNNAGLGIFGDVEAITPEAWAEVIGVNLTAAFLCTREVVPQMKQHRTGTIVNVSSIAGKRGFKGGTAYCASKFGLNGFSEALMEELREFGIRVCSVNPGSTDTEFFDRSVVQPAKRMNPQDVARVIVSAIELPDDVLADQIVVRPL